jgi:hypothetical protein
MRGAIVALSLLLGLMAPAPAQVSIGIGLPGVSIGIHVPAYPALVRVPGQPVYYAPRLQWNYFFYDGLYWVFEGDQWYASFWYDGPWELVAPQAVPVFLLRVPVRYYHRPPPYFAGWNPSRPPRWADRWGAEWERQHRDWDRRNPRAVPAPAPLPSYQRGYSKDRYPQGEQQQALRERSYRYQPRDPLVREHFARPAPSRLVPPRKPEKDKDRR